MRLHLCFQPPLRALALSFLAASVLLPFTQAQQAPQKPSEKPSAKPSPPPEKSENPAQIELLETHYRFETNGDSRKEVHTRVHINNELGVQQFARLNFDYNRSFESIEIPLVHITHPSGGTADILPSAITDNPDPAVVNAPAYQDVRVKSVRILGLEPGDNLEYRVITTTTHHPLAPDFWLDHSFDRSGIVSHEIFELDLPADHVQPRINLATPATAIDRSDAARTIYRWERNSPHSPKESPSFGKESAESEPDIVLSTTQWEVLSIRLDERLTFAANPLDRIGSYEEPDRLRATRVTSQTTEKALELTKGLHTSKEKLEAIYDFVSQKIATVDLPLGATAFISRSPDEIMASGYATSEDKFVLFSALGASVKLGGTAALTGYCDSKGKARPSVFKRLLISTSDGRTNFWLDPAMEVAPFGVIPASSGPCAFILNRMFFVMNSTGHEWQKLRANPPFPSTQRVLIDATLGSDGTLKAKVHYSMRGQNELVLRLAFHQTPKDKWKELAQLLSISDGFRGQVINVTASDPYATKEPFTVDYEITQPKFVDWSKKPVRIPALLPQLGLPDPPAKPVAGAAASPIELGTPLEVETHMTLHVPPGTTSTSPTGTSVQRDYATFASKYSAKGLTVTASRHINFLLRQVLAERAADYNAFLHAVQSDEAQLFTLDRELPATPDSKPACSPATPPPTSKP